jgi:hypothetical protein
MRANEKLRSTPGVSPAARKSVAEATCAMRRKDYSVAVSHAIKQLHGCKSARKIIYKNMAKVVWVCRFLRLRIPGL